MLRAVNAVRAIARWPAIEWKTALSPSDPIVAPSTQITSRQILAARARMDEALQAIGARVTQYTDPDISTIAIRAVHINEVQQRVK